jgi:hypothetical protein
LTFQDAQEGETDLSNQVTPQEKGQFQDERIQRPTEQKANTGATT